MILREKEHLNGIEHLRIKKIQLYLRGAGWGEHNETVNMDFTVLPLEGREPGRLQNYTRRLRAWRSTSAL